ncbi:MAG: hypothetical protein GF401_02925 [Chitinivibrionales bacterium]|nr:hypothetical protein [Chitinivibrionales bacterium]
MTVKTKIMFLAVSACIAVPNAQAELITLTDAESRASSISYEMRSQHFEEQAREWEKRNAVSNYLPSLDYGLNYTQMDQDMVDASNAMFESFEGMSDIFSGTGIEAEEIDYESSKMHVTTVSHEFTVNQPITNGGAEIIAINIAKHTKSAIEFQQEALRQEVIYNARKAYFDVLAAREMTIVTHQDYSWATQNLAKAQTRYEGGAVPKTDILQWEAEVAEKESALLQALAVEKIAVYSLYSTMGVPVEKADTSITLQPLQVFEQWYVRGPVEAEGTVENNPQFKAIESHTRAALGYKRIAASSFFPKINAFGSYSWPYYLSDNDDLVLQEERKGWTAGVSLSVPIFGGFRNSTNYRKSSYEYMKALVDKEHSANQFELNLKRIHYFYQASYKSVAAAKKQHELMAKNLEIMQARYDGGLVNQSQLLEVAVGARMARIGYIQKLFECLLLESEYQKTVGKLEVYQ